MEANNLVLSIELEALQHKIRKSFDYDSEYINILLPLLIKLGWQKNIRTLIECLPHFAEKLTLTEFRNLMVNLGFKSEQKRHDLVKSSPQRVPFLFVSANNQVMLVEEVIVSDNNKEIIILDGKTGNRKRLTNHQIIDVHGVAYFFSSVIVDDEFKSGNWFWFIFKNFKYIIGQIFLVNLLYSILSTSIPIFIMIIYDKIIPSESMNMLFNFSLGIWAVILFMYIISLLKNKMIAYMATRLDKTVAFTVIKHILELPPTYVENSTVNNQITRIKNFDIVCDFFSSPIAMLFFELPLSVIFLIVVMFMGGWLMVVPVVLIAMFFGVFIVGRSLVGEIVKLQTQDSSNKQSFLMETFSHMRWLKSNGAINACVNKFDNILLNIAKYGFKSQIINYVLQAVADFLMLISALIIMGFGSILAMDNQLSTGALIAIMLLTWKIVDPLKMFITSIPLIEQVITSIQQINNLINIPKEVRKPDLVKIEEVNVIELQRISFRYPWQDNPNLLGISFAAEPGAITCIVGKNGSGKSTIIKLILALQHAQSGTIKINNMNINQIDPISIRKAIAYMPQVTNLFFGTIRQNLLFSNPLATFAEIKQAAMLAGFHEDIVKLKNGYDTPLGDQGMLRLSSSFVQKLALARAYLKDAKALIFDNPCLLVDRLQEQKFLDALQYLKQNKIILITTSKISLLEIADHIIYLKSGQIVAAGHPSQILSGILQEYGVTK